MSGPPTDHIGPCATHAEKVAALNALTGDDWATLLRIAKYTAFRKFKGRVNDADARDLLQHVVVKAMTENDKRTWYPPEQTFVSFLASVMSSEASNWSRKASVADSGSNRPRFTELPDDLPSVAKPDEVAEANITYERMRESLKTRPLAVQVFDLRIERLTAKEIQERLGISALEYDSTVKWMIRTLDKGGFRNE